MLTVAVAAVFVTVWLECYCANVLTIFFAASPNIRKLGMSEHNNVTIVLTKTQFIRNNNCYDSTMHNWIQFKYYIQY